MVQIVPQEGGLAGIGGALGKGLSETVPKEVDRMRLAQGLKGLSGSLAGKSPLDQAAALSGIPGMTPELLQQYLPLVRQSAAREESLRNQQQSTGQPAQVSQQPLGSGQMVQAQKDIVDEGEIPKRRGIVTQESQDVLSRPIIRKSDEELRNEARQLSRANPNLYPTEVEAMPVVKEREATRIGQEEDRLKTAKRQQVLEEDIRKGFQNSLGKKIQKGGEETFSDVLGDIQNQLEFQAMEDVATGKLTATQAVDKYTDQGLELAKGIQQLRDSASARFWDTSAGQEVRRINQVRDKFAKLKRLPEFSNYLEGELGLSPQVAASFAFPPDRNKPLMEDLKKARNARSDAQFTQSVAEMGKRIKPNDSLLAIANEFTLQAQRESFMDQIRELYENGEVSLTSSQLNELEKSIPFFPTLADVYYTYGVKRK